MKLKALARQHRVGWIEILCPHTQNDDVVVGFLVWDGNSMHSQSWALLVATKFYSVSQVVFVSIFGSFHSSLRML